MATAFPTKMTDTIGLSQSFGLCDTGAMPAMPRPEAPPRQKSSEAPRHVHSPETEKTLSGDRPQCVKKNRCDQIGCESCCDMGTMTFLSRTCPNGFAHPSKPWHHPHASLPSQWLKDDQTRNWSNKGCRAFPSIGRNTAKMVCGEAEHASKT